MWILTFYVLCKFLKMFFGQIGKDICVDVAVSGGPVCVGLTPEVVRQRRSRAVRRAREAIRAKSVTNSTAELLIGEEPL